MQKEKWLIPRTLSPLSSCGAVATSVAAYLTLGGATRPSAAALSIVWMLTVFSCRRHYKKIAFLLSAWSLLALLIAYSGWLAGASPEELLKSATQTSGRFIFSVFAVLIIAATEDVTRWTDFLEEIRASRMVIYLILSSVTLASFVRNQGTRQMSFLKLKGLVGDRWRDRFPGYLRLVGPLTSVAIRRQIVHAESLGNREFFTREIKTTPALPSLNELAFASSIPILYCVLLLWKN